MEQSNNAVAQHIILDSNIIQNLTVQGLSSKILEVFKDATDKGYGLAISEVSLYELFNEASTQKEKQIIESLENIQTFTLQREILIAAGRLGSLYRDDGIPVTQIGICDKIIAATSILTNSLIYTTDVRDYPVPFFREVARVSIEYYKNRKERIPIYCFTAFLAPDLQIIENYYYKRITRS